MNTWEIVGGALIAMGTSVVMILVGENFNVGERVYDQLMNATSWTWNKLMAHTGDPRYVNPYQPRRYRNG